MARLTSSLADVKDFIPIPKGTVAVAKITKKEDKTSRVRVEDGVQLGGNPMVTVDWTIEEGEFAGRDVCFDNIVLGGTSKKGKPITPFQLVGLLNVTEIPWECTNCNNGEEPRDFYIGKGKDESGEPLDDVQQGQYVCPDCHTAGSLSYDTDNFLGARCKIVIGITDDGKYNTIDRYLPLD